MSCPLPLVQTMTHTIVKVDYDDADILSYSLNQIDMSLDSNTHKYNSYFDRSYCGVIITNDISGELVSFANKIHSHLHLKIKAIITFSSKSDWYNNLQFLPKTSPAHIFNFDIGKFDFDTNIQ